MTGQPSFQLIRGSYILYINRSRLTERFRAMEIQKISLSQTQMRKVIRDRMTESCRIPQFDVRMDVNMEKVIEVRKRATFKPSITACLIWCCAKTLSVKQDMNAFFYGDEIGKPSEINIGVAMTIPGGIIVPVIKNADQKSLKELTNELAVLMEKAKGNRLSMKDIQEGTFTISNLGMYGIEGFTAMINPPQVAIMAVGGLRDGLKLVDGKIESYKYANISVTADHRAIDGAIVADFLAAFKKCCEEEICKEVLK